MFTESQRHSAPVRRGQRGRRSGVYVLCRLVTLYVPILHHCPDHLQWVGRARREDLRQERCGKNLIGLRWLGLLCWRIRPAHPSLDPFVRHHLQRPIADLRAVYCRGRQVNAVFG